MRACIILSFILMLIDSDWNNGWSYGANNKFVNIFCNKGTEIF